MTDDRHLAWDIVAGAVAGATATWIMGKVTSALYAMEDEATRERERAGMIDGQPSLAVAAKKVARLVGVTLGDDQVPRASSALHWAVGIGAGAVYGAFRRGVPGLHRGHGLVFDFLVIDELANWAFSFTKAPTAFPWQAHARGLAGHLVYGATADVTLHGLERAATRAPLIIDVRDARAVQPQQSAYGRSGIASRRRIRILPR